MGNEIPSNLYQHFSTFISCYHILSCRISLSMVVSTDFRIGFHHTLGGIGWRIMYLFIYNLKE